MKQNILAELLTATPETPFSFNLNGIILRIFNDLFINTGRLIKVRFVDFEPYIDFTEMVIDIKYNHTLKISTLHSKNTIFGNPITNHMLRAVHDWLHYTNNLDFSHESELMVNYYQANLFRSYGATQFDLDLLNIETAGQIIYHKKTGEFPENQRNFTISELRKMGYGITTENNADKAISDLVDIISFAHNNRDFGYELSLTQILNTLKN